jgi:hypothetical protein
VNEKLAADGRRWTRIKHEEEKEGGRDHLDLPFCDRALGEELSSARMNMGRRMNYEPTLKFSPPMDADGRR